MSLLKTIGLNIIFIYTFLACISLLLIDVYSEESPFQIDPGKFVLETETFEIHSDKILYNNSSDCLDWYSVVFSPSKYVTPFIQSFHPGLFIFFRNKNECNLVKNIIDKIVGLPNFNQIFDAENVSPIKLYSIEDILYILNCKYDRKAFTEILSNINIFSPDHSELFSQKGEDLKYVHIPLRHKGQNISEEQSHILFGVSDSPESINYLKRVSIIENSKTGWKTNVTISKFTQAVSSELCTKGDFKVIRNISGSGYHWNYETKVISNEDIDSFVLIDLLPKEVFLDVDEITQQNGDKEGMNGKIIPLHHVNIERPSDESSSSLLLNFGYESRTPVHMRYQPACSGCSYREVKLSTPKIIINANKYSKSGDTCMFYSSKLLISHTENVLKEDHQGVVLRIPVGNSDDTYYVFFTTLVLIVLTTTTLGLSIIKY